jgi:hypothetical protein
MLFTIKKGLRVRHIIQKDKIKTLVLFQTWFYRTMEKVLKKKEVNFWDFQKKIHSNFLLLVVDISR